MATESEVDVLADKVAKGLQLDSGGPLLDMEELVYKATPAELQALRQQVLQKQTLSGFDDEGLVKRFVNATKPKGADDGSGDNQSYFNCFQNQIMLPTVLDHSDQLPADLQRNWLCIVCPEGTRVLVIASHQSTRVYDLEGTWICEHDTHLPGGSPNPISQVDDENECTILDCLYNDEQEIYYAVDLLCWKGMRYYKYEASVRLATLLEKLKGAPSLKCITQTNPFRFHSVPMTSSCHNNEICNAIKRASFELTGLLFYHKKALYLPGLSPLGAWVETTYIPTVLDIQVHKLQYEGDQKPHAKRDWRKNRYEMTPEQVTPVYNSAYVSGSHKNAQRNKAQRGGHNRNFGQGGQGGQFIPRPNLPFRPPVCPPFPDYSSGYMNLMGYRPFGFAGFGHNFGNFPIPQPQQQRFSHPLFNQHQPFRDNRKGNQNEKGMGNEDAMKRIMLSIPVPDERPNWSEWERHEVMMSVTMEYAPANLVEEYLAVICPVAKRRIVVSYMGWTCSYNKLLNMDRKFQSALPGGNVRSVQVIKNNDMCILDCLHLKAERTFYILDLMHWKQLPYYQSEAEFRFHWIRQMENEMDLRTCHPENEYMFKSMPRFHCSGDVLYQALEDAPFRVDGLLFFHKSGFYTPGATANVLWLPPEDIEKVLGWKPPDKIMQDRKPPKEKSKPAAKKASASAKATSAAATAATATVTESNTGGSGAASTSSS